VARCITNGVEIDHRAAIGTGTMKEDKAPLPHSAAAIERRRGAIAAVHVEGGLIMPQLWHMGPARRTASGPSPHVRSMRPSAHRGERDRAMLPEAYPDEMAADIEPMSDEDIADVIAGYARSARDARSVGIDGVAIHGGHGYLIDAFLWVGTNHRQDGWGGSIAARAGFGVAVVRAIGPDLPVVFRFSQCKIRDYGAATAQTPSELEAILTPLADAGVDLFAASTRLYDAPAFDGSERTLSGWAKKLTGRAVGRVGRSENLQSSLGGGTVALDNLVGVARRIGAGEFDLMETGRSLIMDRRSCRRRIPARLSRRAVSTPIKACIEGEHHGRPRRFYPVICKAR
jgi:2,4-dienoyl-CoA reductase-like NADH-dependent reductase (Old Yellow Enzyme family)